jgi:hypothetical protein
MRPEPEPHDDLFSWAHSLGVTEVRLKRIIAEVGYSATAVRRRLAEVHSRTAPDVQCNSEGPR